MIVVKCECARWIDRWMPAILAAEWLVVLLLVVILLD